MAENNFHIPGLSEQEVTAARAKYGSNSISPKKSSNLRDALIDLAREPMVVLLLVTAGVYLLSGKNGDALFLTTAIIFVAGISLFQNSRSKKTIGKLKNFTQPKCKVIRNGTAIAINSEDLVVGDSLIIEEGTSVMADGTIVHSNDFSVNESVLTGESLPVFKDPASIDHQIFQGTTIISGLAIATVTAIGDQTRLGQIGRSLENIGTEKTPLELQINNFVKKMVIAGGIVFVIVWLINYLHSLNLLDSLTKALTLAMSILPEEIPVAFTTFMALGAWRLMQMGVVVKQIKTVETLGSASVICTDKTGTLTENRMSLTKLYVSLSGSFYDAGGTLDDPARALIRTAMWASEPIPFDPMEVALHESYQKNFTVDEREDYHMVHEYPLSGKPPMMTHVFENNNGTRIVAAKGAPEALLAVSDLNAEEKEIIKAAIREFSAGGYRVLGVGETLFKGNHFPVNQQEMKFVFSGLVAFYDPPKKNIASVLKAFYRAGIVVKILTGDNALTTQAIAREINFRGADQCIGGDELLMQPESGFRAEVEKTNIFSRMFPDAKLKIINALKSVGEIVAMTGDGVNDGPALKAAHIGIAMGRKGTEIAKEAATLILLEDDLSKMVDAIAMGRRIYANLKKAIQYIISIHIPIILTVFIPLALNWVYPNIFSPVHIIFLELIMGPTCSIVYENEPMEKNTMLRPPRPLSTTFFNWNELATSVIQGLAITAATMLIYKYAVGAGLGEQLTRSMVFSCLLAANIFLTLVNRSFYYSVLVTLRYKNKLLWFVIWFTILLSAVLLYVKPIAHFFEFQSPSLIQLAISAGAGISSVIWFEIIKWVKRS
ncbi:cation-translocating P-type ATPase [Mucilaginibacter segetis]|uniref:Cation-translocating P-type ATPase n=1 Tax=Mucilaginibacter segetis TaxID=2793071 RepID=A0A934ULC7_9SPHI|nr:cation-translocating P-type ATPase [Mucilaginibacter segetis]MBK0378413.1 cation-translocating P-type ATPase [Mucilaginibacter segetis]